MIGQLQLANGSRLRTELALRTALGDGTKEWKFQPWGVDTEGMGFDDKKNPTWGSTKPRKDGRPPWRGKIHGFLEVAILAFSEKSLETKRPLWFPAAGNAIVVAHQHWKNGGKISFGLATAYHVQVGALCKASSGPLVLPSTTTPLDWLQEKLGLEGST